MPLQVNVWPAEVGAPAELVVPWAAAVFGMFAATVPLIHAESGMASTILSGHTESGKVFSYSSCPKGMVAAFVASLSTLPFWLGNR